MPLPHKVVLLGDSSVGKTSLVHRFVSDAFNHRLANTIGAAFIAKDHTSHNRTARLEIWDTAGQERYRALTTMYYRHALAALVCFDASCAEKSFESAHYWIDQLCANGPPDIRIWVVANKIELVADTTGSSDAQVDASVAWVDAFCRNRGIPFVTTSAKTGAGVRELFDAVVDSIPQEAYERYQETDERRDKNALLQFRNRTSGCC